MLVSPLDQFRAGSKLRLVGAATQWTCYSSPGVVATRSIRLAQFLPPRFR